MSMQAERRQLWESRVSAFRSSGQKATKWCAANQINRRQLYNWMKRFNDEKNAGHSPSWVTVHVDQQPKDAFVLLKVGSVAIEVRPGYDAALLADVVRTLQSVC